MTNVGTVTYALPAPVAGFWRRLGAFAIDAALLGTIGIAIGTAFFEPLVALGPAGRVVGFVIVLTYFGVMNSRIGNGSTLGKRALGIRVIDRYGASIPFAVSLLRIVVLSAPFFLNGAFIYEDIPTSIPSIVGFVLLGLFLFLAVFGGSLAIIYLYVANSGTRQSLHDILAGTFVVRADASDPAVVQFWIRHYAILAGWIAAMLLGVGVLGFTLRNSPLIALLPDLQEIQNSLYREPDILVVRTTVGMTTVNGSSSTFLAANVTLGRPEENLQAAVIRIVEIVLAARPTLLDRDLLTVDVHYGYDLGIFRSQRALRRTATPDVWRRVIREFSSSRGV